MIGPPPLEGDGMGGTVDLLDEIEGSVGEFDDGGVVPESTDETGIGVKPRKNLPKKPFLTEGVHVFGRMRGLRTVCPLRLI
jgi:hypothetical protein